MIGSYYNLSSPLSLVGTQEGLESSFVSHKMVNLITIDMYKTFTGNSLTPWGEDEDHTTPENSVSSQSKN